MRSVPLPLSRPLLFVFAAAALLAPAAPAATRAHARAHRTHAPAARAATPAAAAGLVVGVDPVTGRLGMPSAAEMLQLSPAEKTGMMHTNVGLTPVHLPDGSMKVDLQGRYQEFSVLRVDATGRPRVGCFDDPLSLQRWLESREPAAPLEVK